jgi:hypothetical protein
MPDENHDPVAVKDPSIVQVGELRSAGKLTDENPASRVETAEQVVINAGYWQNG